MTSLIDLASRVEALDGPDREVDAEVFRALGCPLPEGFAGVPVVLAWQDDGTATMAIGDLQVRYTPPAYTASVNAVLDLIGRELPGCGHAYTLGPGHRIASARVIRPPIDEGAPVVDPRAWATHEAGAGATPALALLSAFLRAKAAQQQEAERG